MPAHTSVRSVIVWSRAGAIGVSPVIRWEWR